MLYGGAFGCECGVYGYKEYIEYSVFPYERI